MLNFFSLLLIVVMSILFPLQKNSGLCAQNPGDTEQNNTELPEEFDLLFYGKQLNKNELNIFLKTNPLAGSEWMDVFKKSQSSNSIWITEKRQLLVIKNLSMEKYFGQDIRENYITVRISNDNKAYSPEISAIYALSSNKEIRPQLSDKFIKLIENEPLKIEERALASHVRPRPFIIKSGKTLTEHIEAPVRHYKPGVREVEWLDIIFK